MITLQTLFHIARQARSAHAWKRALHHRKQARDAWKAKRIADAVGGDWRALRECKGQKHVGWEGKFAEAVAPNDPHQVLHDHFAHTFSCPAFSSNRSMCPAPSPDITLEELDRALRSGKRGRSVGGNGLNLELILKIAETDKGKQGLLRWFNDILHSGRLPPRWHDVLLILLPKCSAPNQAKQIRGIALGCAAEKLFSRVILERSKRMLHFATNVQCCAPHRQTADLIFSLHRLAEVDREWGAGVCVLRLDLKAAFDNVNRDKLLEHIFARLGDSEEFRVWELLFTSSCCTLQSPWFQSRFVTQQGIRQGAIESPFLFGLIVEWVVSSVISRFKWSNRVSTYPDFSTTQAAFMDDVYLWDGHSKQLETRANQLREEFEQWGLSINAEKSAFYVSPKHSGKPTLKIGTTTLTPQPWVEVMGLPMRVGAGSGELLQSVWQKAKNHFWSLRALLLSDTPIGERLKLMNKLVGASALWCCSALHPETSALISINRLLYQFVVYMLKLKKRADEPWSDFRVRGFRQARQLVLLHLRERWSTVWLSRFWGYQGHVVRSSQQDAPPCSAAIIYFRPVEWWRKQQQTVTGARHKGRFHVKLHPLDDQMNRAAQGEWRLIALDRVQWKLRACDWLLQQDVAWTSGQQLSLEDQ